MTNWQKVKFPVEVVCTSVGPPGYNPKNFVVGEKYTADNYRSGDGALHVKGIWCTKSTFVLAEEAWPIKESVDLFDTVDVDKLKASLKEVKGENEGNFAKMLVKEPDPELEMLLAQEEIIEAEAKGEPDWNVGDIAICKVEKCTNTSASWYPAQYEYHEVVAVNTSRIKFLPPEKLAVVHNAQWFHKNDFAKSSKSPTATAGASPFSVWKAGDTATCVVNKCQSTGASWYPAKGETYVVCNPVNDFHPDKIQLQGTGGKQAQWFCKSDFLKGDAPVPIEPTFDKNKAEVYGDTTYFQFGFKKPGHFKLLFRAVHERQVNVILADGTTHENVKVRGTVGNEVHLRPPGTFDTVVLKFDDIRAVFVI